jgi:hypothetical protein
MKAVLFTQFPPKFIEDTILPKLRERGVEVLRCEPPQRADKLDLSGADVVLQMHEMGSHANDAKVKEATKRAGKRLVYLPRKSGMWPSDLGAIDALARSEGGDVVAMPKAVPDAALEPFLREYIALWDAGHAQQEMVRPLAKYWKVGRLETGTQLNVYARRVYESDRCPDFFRAWWEETRMRPRAAVTNGCASALPDPLGEPAASSVPLEELPDLLKMYEEENGKLRAHVGALEQEVAHARTRPTSSPDASATRDELERQRARASAAEASVGELREREAKLAKAIDAHVRRIEELEKQAKLREGVVRDQSDELAAARAEATRLREAEKKRMAARSTDDLLLTLQQVRTMVDKGFLDAHAAFDKIVAYATSSAKEKKSNG